MIDQPQSGNQRFGILFCWLEYPFRLQKSQVQPSFWTERRPIFSITYNHNANLPIDHLVFAQVIYLSYPHKHWRSRG